MCRAPGHCQHTVLSTTCVRSAAAAAAAAAAADALHKRGVGMPSRFFSTATSSTGAYPIGLLMSHRMSVLLDIPNTTRYLPRRVSASQSVSQRLLNTRTRSIITTGVTHIYLD